MPVSTSVCRGAIVLGRSTGGGSSSIFLGSYKFEIIECDRGSDGITSHHHGGIRVCCTRITPPNAGGAHSLATSGGGGGVTASGGRGGGHHMGTGSVFVDVLWDRWEGDNDNDNSSVVSG